MIFSSFEFFVFLALVLALVGLTRSEELRRNVLLVASYVFYAWWDWRFCFLILGSTLVDFAAAIAIRDAETRAARRAWLIVSVAANLGVLSVFKYANFFLASLELSLAPLGLTLPRLDVILPVGISFFTFQTMSYTIDVYRGSLLPTRNFRDFALFVSFFPQLVAGPIVRGAEFIPQLRETHPLRGENLRVGVEIFLRGFTKKVLFADTLSVFVDPVFADPTRWSPGTCWLAALAYCVQIYYDFSGYSEMAIGVGRMLGFRLPQNFRHPYLATSLSDYWRDWHISLSTWFRDYLYVPLGGNRRKLYRNLFLTMLIAGLWHGAAWTYVVWGALHGAVLLGHRRWQDWRGSSSRAGGHLSGRVVSWAATQLFVLLAFVIFRSPDFATVGRFYRKLAFLDAPGIDWFYVPAILVVAACIALHVIVLLRRGRDVHLDLRRPAAWGALVGLLLLILFYAPLDASPFIYFQF